MSSCFLIRYVLQDLHSKIKENTALQNHLSNTTSQLQTSDEALNSLQQENSDLLERVEKLGTKISALSQDLVAKDDDMNSLTVQLEMAQGSLQQSMGRCEEQSLIVDQANGQLSQLQTNLTSKTEETDGLNSKVLQLTANVDRLDAELDARESVVKDLSNVLENRNSELASLKSELKFSEEAKGKADAELTELQAQLAITNDKSLDSEPTDPEPSEEDMAPTSDPNTLTEVQELNTQLAELQELLAQKVLLINELQGLLHCYNCF